MTWPSATSGTSTPAPPHATNARAPPRDQLLEEPGGERRAHARMHDAQAPSVQVDLVDRVATDLGDDVVDTRPSSSSTTVAITSWKKHSTAWGGTIDRLDDLAGFDHRRGRRVELQDRCVRLPTDHRSRAVSFRDARNAPVDHQRDPHDRDRADRPRPGRRRPGPSRRPAPGRSRTPPRVAPTLDTRRAHEHEREAGAERAQREHRRERVPRERRTGRAPRARTARSRSTASAEHARHGRQRAVPLGERRGDVDRPRRSRRPPASTSSDAQRLARALARGRQRDRGRRPRTPRRGRSPAGGRASGEASARRSPSAKIGQRRR